MILKNALDSDFDVPEQFPRLESMPDLSNHNVLINELHDVCSIDDVSREEQNIVYYVSGFISRSISIRNRCGECKNILLNNGQEKINIEESAFDTLYLFDCDRRTLFVMTNRVALIIISNCVWLPHLSYRVIQNFNCELLTIFLSCQEHKNFCRSCAVQDVIFKFTFADQ